MPCLLRYDSQIGVRADRNTVFCVAFNDIQHLPAEEGLAVAVQHHGRAVRKDLLQPRHHFRRQVGASSVFQIEMIQIANIALHLTVTVIAPVGLLDLDIPRVKSNGAVPLPGGIGAYFFVILSLDFLVIHNNGPYFVLSVSLKDPVSHWVAAFSGRPVKFLNFAAILTHFQRRCDLPIDLIHRKGGFVNVDHVCRNTQLRAKMPVEQLDHIRGWTSGELSFIEISTSIAHNAIFVSLYRVLRAHDIQSLAEARHIGCEFIGDLLLVQRCLDDALDIQSRLVQGDIKNSLLLSHGRKFRFGQMGNFQTIGNNMDLRIGIDPSGNAKDFGPFGMKQRLAA